MEKINLSEIQLMLNNNTKEEILDYLDKLYIKLFYTFLNETKKINYSFANNTIIKENLMWKACQLNGSIIEICLEINRIDHNLSEYDNDIEMLVILYNQLIEKIDNREEIKINIFIEELINKNDYYSAVTLYKEIIYKNIFLNMLNKKGVEVEYEDDAEKIAAKATLEYPEYMEKIQIVLFSFSDENIETLEEYIEVFEQYI